MSGWEGLGRKESWEWGAQWWELLTDIQRERTDSETRNERIGAGVEKRCPGRGKSPSKRAEVGVYFDPTSHRLPFRSNSLLNLEICLFLICVGKKSHFTGTQNIYLWNLYWIKHQHIGSKCPHWIRSQCWGRCQSWIRCDHIKLDANIGLNVSVLV